MSDVMAKLPDDSPLMIAWEAYKRTDGYANTLKWARHVAVKERETNALIEIQHPHTEGSLWAAFMAGYNAALRVPTNGDPS
jgi:hypothetical protein